MQKKRVATKTLARWPQVGGVPYQALPLLRFFRVQNSRTRKVRKGEGEQGDEARAGQPFYMATEEDLRGYMIERLS